MSHPRAQFVLFDGCDTLDVLPAFEALSRGSQFLGGGTSGLDVGIYLLERDFGSQTADGVEEMVEVEYERRGTVWRAPQQNAV